MKPQKALKKLNKTQNKSLIYFKLKNKPIYLKGKNYWNKWYNKRFNELKTYLT